MEKSPSIVNLAKALLTFNVKVGKISKDASNPYFKSKYASLSNILEEIAMPLAESGLVFSQLPSGDNGLTTILIHAESGEYLQSEYYMHPTKNDPQGTGSAISYARRYALTSILALNVEDDDANEAAGNNTSKTSAAPMPEKPWLDKNSKKYDLVVEKLKAGTTTINQVSQFFKLNKDVRAAFAEIEKKP